ncbi:calmin-like isoform X2 [Notolabrus celidotus]|nr:calmin-like isoform X2 [Notolabrus celidotus]XP_034555588.1 calmin-like isoform X2 [Notolabrus celidotus]
MALLEELSGYKLLYRFRSSSNRIFRLNNISKALAFLDDRHVKLLGIDASSVADGVPSVVLNLIWNIILHFQVKEVTGGLQKHSSSSLSSLSMSPSSSSDLVPQLNDLNSHSCSTLHSEGRMASRKPKYHGKAIKTLLQWVQGCTLKFGVEVRDFGKSWRSGLAFLAVIKSINPALVDLRESLAREPRENVQLAFNIAHHSLDIPPLLEPDDVMCSSPDEKSIITYVSLFLEHFAGVEEGQKEDTEVEGIPSFGSLESVTLGDIPADESEAKALLKGFERSSEQRLWRRWTRRHPGSSRTTSLHSSGAVPSDLSSSCGDIFSACRSQGVTEQQTGSPTTSTYTKKRRKSVLKPPSPLDAGIASPEIRSWMEKASTGQSYSKPRVDESRFSLSSEEGIYNLSALDSDEEEAYNYILQLNKEDGQPQTKRQVPRVEEETAEEMFLNGQQAEESNLMEVRDNLTGSGCKHQEGSPTQNVEVVVRVESSVQQECSRDKFESSPKEMVNNGAVFDMEPEDKSTYREGHSEDRVVRAQSNDDAGYLYEVKRESDRREGREEDEEHLRLFKDRHHRRLGTEKEKADAKEEETRNQPNILNVEGFKVEVNLKIIVDKPECEGREAGAIRMNTDAKENGSKDNTSRVEDLPSNDEDKDSMETGDEKDWEPQIKRRTLRETTIDRPGKATHKNDTNGGVKVHGDEYSCTCAGSATSQSFRRGGFIPQSLAASCGITPLELKMLLVLWILIYCCFILQFNL